MSEPGGDLLYLEGASALSTSELDAHVAGLPTFYYGEKGSEGTAPEEREREREREREYSPIRIEDSSGATNYSVRISGNLMTAKRILVKTMPWSDHPGRGFEALREVTIADAEQGIAVVGISFPGVGLNSAPMTHNQKKSLQSQVGEHMGVVGPAWNIVRELTALTPKQQESLSLRNGDFSFIGAQQWEAIMTALRMELSELERLRGESKTVSDFEFVIAGSSQGASNAVGLLQSVREDIRLAGLGLIQDTGLEPRYPLKFVGDFVRHGNKRFKDYVDANPYNDYPQLGPNHNTALNALRRPASHLTTIVGAMARGIDIEKVVKAWREKELGEIAIALYYASEDGLSTPEMNRRAELTMRASGMTLARSVVWPGHYHPVMERLANARVAFRAAANLS